MTVAASTELECINIMLSAIGEAPVSSLIGSVPNDVRMAQNVLTEINKKVQSEGWSFNTELSVTLIRDTNNHIVFGADVLRVDVQTPDHPSIDPIQRGNKLYDRKNNTFVFDEDLKCTVVYYRTFDEIPEQARSYMTIKAARTFVDRMIGDNTLRTYTLEDEIRARAILMETDLSNADHNMLIGDPALNDAINTFSPIDVLNR
tara:strand:- start:1087 stop:1695 length:609 start_codon:yes stop_codon:yes gene_type:complete